MNVKTPHTDDTLVEALDQILSNRWSCRAFLPKTVPEGTITKILQIAQKTASWNNTQPWQLDITSGAATEKFRSALLNHINSGSAAGPHFAFPREYAGIYKDRRRACGFSLYEAVGIQRGDKPAYARQTRRNFEFFDAPHVAIISSEDALGTYGAVDCGAYVSNFMLAASSLNVATIAQGALANYSDFIREYLGWPGSRNLVCGISFGYADKDDPSNNFRTTRADLGEVVRFVTD
ncbi:MAG: nitroreductase [Emcibacteraceae bacterium]|jgi:nitroreductase|nr:nitroreductase [Emcibacteraceae bacterium]|tara:strand:+ start:4710 stop:5414 length:705 start_codon:yes stop_codon:yes gene_type:complete